jgi:hypothetical protein
MATVKPGPSNGGTVGAACGSPVALASAKEADDHARR